MSVGGNTGSRAGEEMIQWKGAELKACEAIQENHTHVVILHRSFHFPLFLWVQTYYIMQPDSDLF